MAPPKKFKSEINVKERVKENGTQKKRALTEVEKPATKRQRFELPIADRPTERGLLFVCGEGISGQLGLGEDKCTAKKLTNVASVTDVVEIKAGGMHSVVLTNDGKVYTFGCNDEGALGRDISEEGSDYVPKVVKLPGKAVAISAGDSHSAALLEDGRVFAWGNFRDTRGVMGLNAEGKQDRPIQIIKETCVAISSGTDHLVMLTNKGQVFTIGCAEQGQLGRVGLRACAGGGRVGNRNLLTPGQITLPRTRFDAIWATKSCTFLQEKGTNKIYACGLNNYVQLCRRTDGGGDESWCVYIPFEVKALLNVHQIAGGLHHTLFLDEKKIVYAIGSAHYGRLGLGESVKDDVTDLREIKGLKGEKVLHISAGENNSFAITEDGKCFSWGMAEGYKLGTCKEDDVFTPVRIRSEQTDDKRFINVDGGGQHSLFLIGKK